MDDPELRLLIAACRAAYSSEQFDFSQSSLRWERLLQLADRHRVQAHCWHGLQLTGLALPSTIASQFAERSQSIVDANLRAAAECNRLHELLSQDGIPHLFLKGLTLGSLAYPQPLLKMSWDIDLLIGPRDIKEAGQLLRNAGYRPVIPFAAEDNLLERWHQRRKESVWSSATGGFTLDLHTSLADNPRILPGIGAGSPNQMVPIAAGISLPTLCKDELFAYLCVHGASSAWFRLKWICDFAALLRQEPELEVARLYERSQQLGTWRAADQALLLADELFGIAMPGQLRERIRSRPASRWLRAIARTQLTNVTEPTDRPLGTASIHYSQLLLKPSWRFKLSEFARQFRAVVERSPRASRLPDAERGEGRYR